MLRGVFRVRETSKPGGPIRITDGLTRAMRGLTPAEFATRSKGDEPAIVLTYKWVPILGRVKADHERPLSIGSLR